MTALQALVISGCDAEFIHAYADSLALLRLKVLGLYVRDPTAMPEVRALVAQLPHLRQSGLSVLLKAYRFASGATGSLYGSLYVTKEKALLEACLPGKQNITYAGGDGTGMP